MTATGSPSPPTAHAAMTTESPTESLTANGLAIAAAAAGILVAGFHPGSASTHAGLEQIGSLLGGFLTAGLIKLGHLIQRGLSRNKVLAGWEKDLLDEWPAIRDTWPAIQAKIPDLAMSAVASQQAQQALARVAKVEQTIGAVHVPTTDETLRDFLSTMAAKAGLTLVPAASSSPAPAAPQAPAPTTVQLDQGQAAAKTGNPGADAGKAAS